MTTAENTSVANSGGSSAASLTFALTITNANLLIVGAMAGTVGGVTVTGVTYNGAALTKITSATYGGTVYTSLWYLKNPATGAHNVVVTYSSASYVVAGATGVVGADLINTFGTSNGANGATATYAVTVSSQ